MNMSNAVVYGDKKIIKILNSINDTKREDFLCTLSNKTSEMRLSAERRKRLLDLAEIRLKELQNSSNTNL